MIAFATRPLALVREHPPAYGAGVPHDLETLGDEIATLAAHIHAATHRLLTLLAGPTPSARVPPTHAAAGSATGTGRAPTGSPSARASGHRRRRRWSGAAREKVRAARALASLPETSAAMSRGELLEIARECSTAQLERVVWGWRRGTRRDEAARERERHDSRALSLFHGDDGMVVVRGRLTPEVGALR